jgi:HEAT repeat protein
MPHHRLPECSRGEAPHAWPRRAGRLLCAWIVFAISLVAAGRLPGQCPEGGCPVPKFDTRPRLSPAEADKLRLEADPVEAFRRALKLEQNPVYKSQLKEKELKGVMDFRRKNLERAAARVRTLSELSRALLLIEWGSFERAGERRPEAPEFDVELRLVDQAVRTAMTRRFVQRMKNAVQRGAPNRQVALANLIGETVSGAANLGDDRLRLYTSLAPLVEDLIFLSRSPRPVVRAAAARAMGQFPSIPDKVVPALRRLLESDPSATVRESAATALATLVQVVSGRETSRRSEPGVSVRESRPTIQTFGVRERVAVGARVVPAAALGLNDSCAAVRRAAANALRQVTLTVDSLIFSPTGGATAEPLYPPRERPWTETDRQLVEEGRREVQALKNDLRPVLQALAGQGSALATGVCDRDAETRITSRRVVDDLTRIRRRLRDYERSVPSEPAPPPGEMGARPAPVPGAVSPTYLRPPLLLSPPAPVSLGRPVVSSDIVLVSAVQEKPGDLPPPRKGKDAEMPPPAKAGGPKLNEADPLAAVIGQAAGAMVRCTRCDPNYLARRYSLEALESMEDLAAPYVNDLIAALCDPDVFVRWIAARSLGKLAPRGGPAAVSALTQHLGEYDLDLRVAVANALGLYGPQAASAVPTLKVVVNRGDSEYRIAVMKAIESIGVPAVAALPAIAEELDNMDPRVRAEAARVLGRFGPLARGVLHKLRPLNNDPDQEVRKVASEAYLLITRPK